MNLIARNSDGQALAAVPLRMSRLFDTLLDPWQASSQHGTWFPHMDVLETTEAIEVFIDFPGMDPNDVDLSIHEDRLEISGVRPANPRAQEARWYRFERHAGDFHRVLTLPVAVNSDEASATTVHGQLHIVLPKAAEARPRRITIQGE